MRLETLRHFLQGPAKPRPSVSRARVWVWFVPWVACLAASSSNELAANPVVENAQLFASDRAPAVPQLFVAPAPTGVLESAPSASCPEEMVELAGYCIDRYEDHLLVQGSDGSWTLHPPHLRPPTSSPWLARSEAGRLPQAYISQIEATEACTNAGKRLCTVVEWYRACRGQGNTIYPYGPKFEAGRCNVGKPHLLSLRVGADSRVWQYEAHFNDPILDQLPGFLAHTGEFRGCVTDQGVYDMVGNLHEWVADKVDYSLGQKLPLKNIIRGSLAASGGKGIFMGGFFSTLNQHGRGCAFVTTAHETRYHDYSTGFRCCRDTSPPNGARGDSGTD